MNLVGKWIRVADCEYGRRFNHVGHLGLIKEVFDENDEFDYVVEFGKNDIDFLMADEVELVEDNIIEFEKEYEAKWVGEEEMFINPKDHALVFVQTGLKNDWVLYQDGKELKGLKSVDIAADIEYPTEHTLKLVTGATKE